MRDGIGAMQAALTRRRGEAFLKAAAESGGRLSSLPETPPS